MKTFMSIVLSLNSLLIFAQPRLDDVEAILKKDPSIKIYDNYRPFLLMKELNSAISTTNTNYFGRYKIDSMKEREIKGYQGKEILIRSNPNPNESLLFGFTKKYENLEIGNLSYLTWSGKKGIIKQPEKLFLVTPVAGLALKDRVSGYTYFVRVSKDGAPFPVHVVSDTRDSSYTHPVLDVHSLENNDIEAIYLFDNFWGLRAIYTFSKTHSLQVTSFHKEAKRLTLKFEDKITHSELINLYEKCNLTGSVLKKFSLQDGWLQE